MKYEVTLSFIADYTAKVEADCEDDAEDMVRDMCCKADEGDFNIYDMTGGYVECLGE